MNVMVFGMQFGVGMVIGVWAVVTIFEGIKSLTIYLRGKYGCKGAKETSKSV